MEDAVVDDCLEPKPIDPAGIPRRQGVDVDIAFRKMHIGRIHWQHQADCGGHREWRRS